MSRITMQDVAVMSVQYVQHSFDYYLDSMERCGLRRVDLWGGAPHYCRLDYSSAAEAGSRVKELRHQIEDRGMRVVIYTPETLGYAMDDALGFGTNRVFLNTGCHPRDLPREEGWKRTVESFRALADEAEARGVLLVLEQLQPYESNLVITLEDVSRMLRDVDSPALRVCVDLVAMEVAGERLEDYCQRFGEKLEWVHYSDSHHLILGDGDFGREKLEEYVRILEKHDFANGLDLEINDSIYWEDPHESIRRSCEVLRDFLPEE